MKRKGLGVVALLLTLFALVPPAHAAPLYFDADNSTTWDDGTTANWANSSGGPYNTGWSGGSDAHFEGTAGTVNVSGTIASVNAIAFDVAGYTLSGGIITMTGDAQISGQSGTVSANLAGLVGLDKTGSGKLTLSGQNTFSGQVTVAEGTLSINAWNTDNNNGRLGNSNTKVVLGGEGTVGTLEYTGGIIGSGQSLRGVEVASGGHGTVHLLFSNTGTTFPTDETYRNRYIHIDGNRIGGSGGLTIDTRSPNGEHGSRFIITNPGGTTFSGSLTVASNSEVQFSAPSDSPFTFGSGTVTVDAGGILNLWRNGAATVTLGGLAGEGLVRGDASGLKTYRVGSNNDSTAFSGIIANGRGGATVALTKVGEGTLTLSGATTYTGGTRVEQGVLALGGTNRLATSGAITVDGGTLDLGGSSQTTSAEVTFLAGAVTNGTLAKSGANYNAQGGAVSANLAGSVGLDKTGTGKLTLSGDNTFSGILSVAEGTLSINAWNTDDNNGPLGYSNTKVVLGGDGTTGTLQYTGGNLSSSTWRGIQVDDGRTGILHLAFDGTGQSRYIHIPASQLDIRGSLTVDARDGTTIPDGDTLRRRMIVTSPDSASLVFTGQLTVAQHTELQLSAPVATPFNFGSGTITVNEGGILNLYATATGGADATVTLGGLAGEGVVRGDAGGLKTYRVGSNHLDTEFSGAIIDGRSGATVALTKVGDGVLTLWGSNTYTQATNVEKGTLLVNGSLTGTSGVTVHDGATLGGTGTIAAAVAGEGWISPGNSAGILTVQSIDPADGLNARFEFGKTESPNYADAANSINDVLRITGANPITGPLTADNMIDVYFGIAPNLGDVFRGGVYVDVAGDPQGLTDFYDAVAGAKYNYYVHDGGGYVSLNDYASWLDVAVSTVADAATFGGGDPVIGGVMQFTLVPEPGTWLMLLSTVAFALLGRRRRK